MSIQFAPRHHTFSEPGTQSSTYDFSNKVRTAGGSLQAYAVSFGSSDHHLRDLEVSVKNVVVSGNRVNYDVTFNMRDGSNNKGKAEIDILLMADTESA